MHQQSLEIALKTSGILSGALEDGLRRLQHTLADDASAEDLAAAVEQLRAQAPHLYPPADRLPLWEAVGLSLEDFQTLPSAERRALARQQGQGEPPAVRTARRPVPFTPTTEQLKELEGKSPAEQRTRYRQWQDKKA
jgi:hypothetical protein